ncbi:hypothetical protein K1719_043559 [Acacia pycnantha]|nr:hypothetical protein K1719_043559 [Acacia pycnantha]
MTEAEELDMGVLYKAIYDNNWPAAKAFIDAHPSALDPQVAATTGETPLHFATKLGLVGIVEELVRLVPSQYLETLDADGYTPLFIAATFSGVIPLAKCLINKNSNTLAIPEQAAKKLSEFDQINKSQEVKFMNFMSAADELMEHLKSENNQLHEKANE